MNIKNIFFSILYGILYGLILSIFIFIIWWIWATQVYKWQDENLKGHILSRYQQVNLSKLKEEGKIEKNNVILIDNVVLSQDKKTVTANANIVDSITLDIKYTDFVTYYIDDNCDVFDMSCIKI